MKKKLIKNTFTAGLLIFLSVILFSACETSDAKLQKQVTTVLTTAYPAVSVAVKDGVVTLSGEVNSQDIRTGAEALAQTIKNVKSVTNNITVTPPVVNTNPDME